LVDNGDEGDSAEAARSYPSVRLLHQPKPGSYAARNAGLAVAKGDVIVFTDADCMPDRRWLESGVSEMLRGGACLLAGRIDVTTRQFGRPTAVELYEVVFGYRQEYAVRSGSAFTANLFVGRAVIDAIGPFDESLRSGGDFEFSKRAGYHGFRLAYSPLPAVSTPARRTLSALWRRSARLRGGQKDLRRLRAAGVPWLEPSPAVRSRFADFQMIAAYPAPLRSRIGSIGVAVFVRAAFKAEGLRLALGGEPRR
jgi:glycosyltransferase involved in cell wall biosynthesis